MSSFTIALRQCIEAGAEYQIALRASDADSTASRLRFERAMAEVEREHTRLMTETTRALLEMAKNAKTVGLGR